MKMLRRALDLLYLSGAVLAAICLAAITLLVIAQVIGRWFGMMLPAIEEIAGYLMAAATFLALAWTLRSGGHIRVNLLLRRLPPRARRVQEFVACAALVALSAAMTWWTAAFVFESREFGDVSSGYLAIPLWIPQLPMPLGLALLTLAIVDDCVTLLAGRAPSWNADGSA